jgi:hypothetical protein
MRNKNHLYRINRLSDMPMFQLDSKLYEEYQASTPGKIFDAGYILGASSFHTPRLYEQKFSTKGQKSGR